MAGLIPKQFIDDLLTRIDIVEVIDERVPLKKAGKDYKACCPFHDEKTPSFTVSTDKQFYHCFGCGAHGTAIGFLMEYEHLAFPEAVEELARRAGLEVPHEGGGRSAPQQDSTNLIELLREAAHYYRSQLREHPQAGLAVDYLKRRGITGEIAKDFELGFAPDGWDNLARALGKDEAAREAMVTAGLAVKKEGGGFYDRFRARVMFPIHDHRGRIVGFGGRVIDKGEPKYLNSPETPLFHKGRELYGLFRARDAIKHENRVLVVEGYMDVVALAQFGINFAVATLGTATTREHLERLYRHAPEVVFCFDGDRAGREAAWRALENALPVLHEGRQASFLFLPEGEDPDTLVRKEGPDAFRNRVRSADTVVDYLVKELAAKVDWDRSDAGTRHAELVKPHLAKIASPLLRISILDRLNISPAKRQSLAILPEAEGGQTAALQKRPKAFAKEPPSMVRLALALMLANPKLAADAPAVDDLADLDLPGVDVFMQIVELLHAAPGLNTAAVLEHFRGTEFEQALLRLVAWQHPVLESPDPQAEFAGIVDKLRKDAVKRRTERLLQKEKAQGLSSPEKAELARLLARKTTDSGQFRPSH